MVKPRLRRFQVRLTARERRQWEKLAAQDGMTLSELVRAAVRFYTDWRQAKPKTEGGDECEA